MRRLLAALAVTAALLTLGAGTASADNPGMTHNVLAMTHN